MLNIFTYWIWGARFDYNWARRWIYNKRIKFSLCRINLIDSRINKGRPRINHWSARIYHTWAARAIICESNGPEKASNPRPWR